MNSDSNDAPVICWRCKRQPASATYMDRTGKWSEQVCDKCLDRLQIQEAMEWGIVETFPLEKEERYDEILSWLDTFEAANRHRDHDGWLARSVAAHRGLVLWQAERYEDALLACNVVEQLGFENVTDRWALGVARARNYEEMEKHAEALAAFEAEFRHQDSRYVSAARYFMRSLVEFSANAGKPVDESWRPVVQNIADEYEVEFPVRPTLAESIVALFEATENKLTKRQRNT